MVMLGIYVEDRDRDTLQIDVTPAQVKLVPEKLVGLVKVFQPFAARLSGMVRLVVKPSLHPQKVEQRLFVAEQLDELARVPGEVADRGHHRRRRIP